MTFTGLILTLILGYAAGLVFGPHFRGKSRWGEVSIASGIAGALGASAPYVLLNSVWAQDLLTERTSPGGIAGALIWLTEHALITCSVCSAIAIITAGLLLHNPAEQSAPLGTANENRCPPISSSNHALQLRKNAIWWLLCLPAVAFSLWHRLSRQPISGTGSEYFVGALFVVGLLGHVISSAVAAIRQK